MGKDNLRIMLTESCLDLGKKVDKQLMLIRKSPESFIAGAQNPTFSNGEINGIVLDSVRGSDLFIFTDVGNHGRTYDYYGKKNRKSPNDNYIELLNTIDACANTADKLWVVTPLLFESRQHKREKREALSCAQSLRILEFIGVNGIITFDAHDPTVRSALNKTSFDTIFVTNTMLEHFFNTEKIDFNELMVIHPDDGATKRANHFGRILEVPVGGFKKERDTSKVVDGKCRITKHEYVGNTSLEGKNLLVVDDMIASGESMIDVASSAKDKGANKVYLFATFGLFSNGQRSIDKFNKAYEDGDIEKVYITNLSYVPNSIKKQPWVEIVDCAPTIAKIVSTLHDKESIAPFMDGAERITEIVKQKKLGTYPSDK